MSKLITKLPPFIRKKAEQYRTKNTDSLFDAFNWNTTPEKQGIWYDVWLGKYESFYNFHNLNNNKKP
jgi:hypothetical protein